VIEFERSLPSKRADAEQRLRGYCAGLWNGENPRRSYICIASDGLQWITYHPRPASDGQLRPEDVTLEPRESLTVGSDSPPRNPSFSSSIDSSSVKVDFARTWRLSPVISV